MPVPIFKYESASVAIKILKDKGYTVDFNLEENEVYQEIDKTSIDFVFRYEGESNQDDQSIVYGINCNNRKGVFVSGYSAESNEELEYLLWKKTSEK